jgi:ketosteroid isomerase-like protein
MRRSFVWIVAGLVVGLGAAQPADAQRSAVAQQVFAAESSFAATMANRDSVGFATFVAADAVFFGGRKTTHGRAEVVADWRGFFIGPSAPFSWRPQTIEVLESGTLAHSSGPVFDATGKQVSTFNSVWRKDPDGKWRVVFDKGCSCLAP